MAMSSPVKKTNELLHLYNVQSILEVGCGRGGIIAQFSAPWRIGIDFNLELLKEAHKNYPDILFLQLDANNLPNIWLPGSIEAVIGFDILEHLPEPGMAALIQNCEDLAKKLVIFFSPLDEEGLAMQPAEADNAPGMKHIMIIREELFLKRGYSTFKYPNYHGENITAMLAIKEM